MFKRDHDSFDVSEEIETRSIDTISSADERDLQLLLSGEYEYYFKAYELIKQFSAARDKK